MPSGADTATLFQDPQLPAGQKKRLLESSEHAKLEQQVTDIAQQYEKKSFGGAGGRALPPIIENTDPSPKGYLPAKRTPMQKFGLAELKK